MNNLLGYVLVIFLICTSLNAQSWKFKVAGYFDGTHWHEGYYSFTIKDDQIANITKLATNAPKELKSYLIPPLVDAHVHLSLLDKTYDNDFSKTYLLNEVRSLKKTTHLITKRLIDYRKKGFFFLRDLGGQYQVLKEVKKKFDTPTVILTSKVLASNMGQCPSSANCQKQFININKLTSKELNKLIKNNTFGDVFKVYSDNDPFTGHISKEKMNMIINSAHQQKVPLAIHVTKNFKNIAYSSLKPQDSIEHFYNIDSKFINSATKKLFTVVPTTVPSSFIKSFKKQLPYEFIYEQKNQIKRLKLLLKSNINLCFGSDFYYETHSHIRSKAFWAIEAIIELMRLSDSIRGLKIATSNCASVFGEKDLGKIQKKMKANFNILYTHPIKNPQSLHNIEKIVKDGKVITN